MNKYRLLTIASLLLLVCGGFAVLKKKKPVLYIIGDSTVRNGDGTGKNLQWGWGSFLADYFDTTRIGVENHAIGGRSSRTFITEGRWDKILMTLKKGDYVIMQFGHNDASPLDDTARARGTIRGVGTDSTEIWNPIRKMKEMVHTYGWYMRKFVRDTKEHGATAIICSLVPRNNWKDGKVSRSADSWGLWARQVAEQEGAYFIDLNELVSVKYEALGEAAVKKFFPADNTHTNQEGAKINTETVVSSIRAIKPGSLAKYLKK